MNGELHSTPHVEVDKSCLGLHQVEVDHWGGYVFARLSQVSHPLSDMLGEIPGRVRRYPLDELRTGHRIDHDAVEFWDLVNKQDWGNCESVQRRMNSRVFDKGYYAPMEDYSLDIRDYVRDRVQKD